MTKPPAETLKDRFEVRREIGRGAQGLTFLGVDRQTKEKVAIKELTLGDIPDWKAIELFEREAQALRILDHPSIPRYVDAFHTESSAGERFFLVQEFIKGDDLSLFLEGGGRFNESEACQFLQEMLATLSYLHGLSPPVIHRDIKPSNIIQREDGRFALIDFGGVQILAAQTVGGSTIVGTSGYMAPEQLLGRAVPASDLYGLAATTVHLLSGRAPDEMESDRLELQFRSHTPITLPLADLLEHMLAPSVEARYDQADDVLQILNSRSLSRGDDPEFDHFVEIQREFAGGSQLVDQLSSPQGLSLFIGASTLPLFLGLYVLLTQNNIALGLSLIAVFLMLVVPLSIGLRAKLR